MHYSFIAQFSKNIKFSYSSFDRVILCSYILDLFYEAGVASFLKSMCIVKRSNGLMRIFTDPSANRLDILSFKGVIDIALLSLVKYLLLLVGTGGQANLTLIFQFDIPILWRPSVHGGKYVGILVIGVLVH